MVTVSIQLQCDRDSDSGVCVVGQPGRWLSWELEARGCRRVSLELWLGQSRPCWILGVAGNSLPEFAVPPGGQLWASPAAVP